MKEINARLPRIIVPLLGRIGRFGVVATILFLAVFPAVSSADAVLFQQLDSSTNTNHAVTDLLITTIPSWPSGITSVSASFYLTVNSAFNTDSVFLQLKDQHGTTCSFVPAVPRNPTLPRFETITTGCVLTTGDSVTAKYVFGNVGISFNFLGDSGGNPFLYLTTDGSYYSNSLSTRFITLAPAGGTVATTTTVGATGFVSAGDYHDGLYLHVSFSNQTVNLTIGSALDAWNSAFGSVGGIDFPVTSAGAFSFSTTTTFPAGGLTKGSYSLQSPSFLSSLWFVGGLFNGNVVLASTTSFIIGQETAIDTTVRLGGSAIASTFLTGTSSTPLLDCPLGTNFDLGKCLISVVVPSSQAVSNLVQTAHDGLLSYYPFGLITRFYAIVSATTSTSTLPALSVTIPSGFPSGGSSITLTPWGKLMGVGSFLGSATSTATGLTFVQTFEPSWDIFWYFVFGVTIIFRLLGLQHLIRGKQNEK